MQTSWQSQKNILDEGVITRLQFCAEELSKHYTEEALAPEDLEDITKLLLDLFDHVEQSSIHLSLKLAVLEELERIRSSLSMYRIKGAKGVKEAMQALLGSVVANREALQEIREDNSDVLDRLGKLIDKLDTFTARAMKLKKVLSGPVRSALEFLSSPSRDTSDEEPNGDDETEADI